MVLFVTNVSWTQLDGFSSTSPRDTHPALVS